MSYAKIIKNISFSLKIFERILFSMKESRKICLESETQTDNY